MNLAPIYTTKKSVSNCKVSTVVIATETNSKDEVIVRSINSYDKKKHPKSMQKELVFQVQNALKTCCNIPELPRIAEISAFLPNVQVVQAVSKNWLSVRHHQNLSPNGAMPERFVSACALYILRALNKIHKEGIIHC